MASLFDKIKQIIKGKKGSQHLSDNPYSAKYMFVSNVETIMLQALEECKVWYSASSDWIRAYYLDREISGNAEEPIFNRNRPTYFWGLSEDEYDVKFVHSGLPKAIVDTISNVVGTPAITIEDENTNAVLQAILEDNDYANMLCQQIRPLTCVEGWGAVKINFDKSVSNHPIIQFYDGEDVSFITKQRRITGIVFKDYYKYNNKNYVMIETRRIENGDAIIEYELNTLYKNEVQQVPLSTIPDLAYLPSEPLVIKGYKDLFGAIPIRYFYDPMNKNYGASIYAGKIDLFDDLDQCLSQASQTDRVSTPVEYYPDDLCERDNNGKLILPKRYNRQYMKGISFTDGDGKLNGQIVTTQPVLNFEQYSARAMSLTNQILIGVLSPATMGIDVSRKDNADAQREKEKVTIMTRNNIMVSETIFNKKLANQVLNIQEYMDTGDITLRSYEVSVKYCEFANPSFENLARTLLPLYTSNAISTEMYVEKLYGDSLSEEEKQTEIEKLEALRNSDNIGLGDYGLDDNNENEFADSLPRETKPEEELAGTQE